MDNTQSFDIIHKLLLVLSVGLNNFTSIASGVILSIIGTPIYCEIQFLQSATFQHIIGPIVTGIILMLFGKLLDRKKKR